MRLFRSKTSILDECLAAIRGGETVETCLARYPNHADELRPLLTLAQKVASAPPAAARPWAQTAAWNAVRQRAAELRTGKRRPKPTPVDPWGWARPVAVAMVLVLAIVGAGAGTAIASQDALPDSPLYRVKLATEDVRVWITFNESDKADVLLDQSNERAAEMAAMVQKGKPVPENVLSALKNRNERAAEILASRPQETDLRARLLAQAESQERLLVEIWPEVGDSAHSEYADAVAQVHNTRLQNTDGLVSISPEDLSDGVQIISGTAEFVSEGVWVVGGVPLRIDERTIGSAQLENGASAKFVVGRSFNGVLQALTLSTVQTDTAPTGAIVGNIDEITDDGIVIGGQLIPTSQDTRYKVKLRKGQRVEIALGSDEHGAVAASVKAAPGANEESGATALTFEGTLEGDVRNPNQWTVGGLTFAITSNTLEAGAGAAQAGARVLVEASVKDGKLTAEHITVLASDAPADTVFVVGVFQGFDEEQGGVWLIGGIPLDPPPGVDDPARGSIVAIDARRESGDLVVTQFVVTQTPDQTDRVRFDGAIAAIDGSQWSGVFGQVRVSSSRADVYPKRAQAQEGMRVIGWAERGRDGKLEARYARLLDSRPAITAPISTPAPTP